MPRNMAVMMILNEVAESSMNGGGASERNLQGNQNQSSF